MVTDLIRTIRQEIWKIWRCESQLFGQRRHDPVRHAPFLCWLAASARVLCATFGLFQQHFYRKIVPNGALGEVLEKSPTQFADIFEIAKVLFEILQFEPHILDRGRDFARYSVIIGHVAHIHFAKPLERAARVVFKIEQFVISTIKNQPTNYPSIIRWSLNAVMLAAASPQTSLNMPLRLAMTLPKTSSFWLSTVRPNLVVLRSLCTCFSRFWHFRLSRVISSSSSRFFFWFMGRRRWLPGLAGSVAEKLL